MAAPTIFLGQSYLRLIVNTGMNLSLASVTKINYRKPSGVTGSWIADAINDKSIIYNIKSGELDEIGLWKIQAFALIDNRVALGATNSLKVIAVI